MKRRFLAAAACALLPAICTCTDALTLTPRTTDSWSYTPRKFDVESYKGATGKVLVPFAGPCTLWVRQGLGESAKRLRLLGNNGEIICPAGTFAIEAVTTYPTAEDGAEGYSLSIPFPHPDGHRVRVGAGFIDSGPAWRKLVVAPGSAQTLAAGPPYTAWVTAEQVTKGGKDAVRLTLSVEDQNGYPVTINGPGAPGFEMLSKSGDVLMTGKFPFG